MYVCMYVCRFQNVVLRCPTPKLHYFSSSHWPSFRFLSFMTFPVLSIQFFFCLARTLFCFGIHFNAIFGNLPSAILCTWPYHVSWFCSISVVIGSSNPIRYLTVTFLILSFQVYSHSYFKVVFYSIFTIKLFVSGSATNCTDKIHLCIIVALSLPTSSHDWQPRSVSAPSLHGTCTDQTQTAVWCMPRAAQNVLFTGSRAAIWP